MLAIAILVPVLGRPASAAPLAESVRKSTTVPHRLIFIASIDDQPQVDACGATGADVLVASWTAGRGDFARKINLGYRETAEPFLFQGADDLAFEPGWDVEALAAIDDGDRFGVCGTNDDANPLVRQGRHSTHSLIRRGYVDECGGSLDGPGIVFSESYSHQYCDNELVELAMSRGCFTFAPRAVVRHRHPIWRTAEMDATYRKGQADSRGDAILFRQRRREWA